jgi:hypothetical protein
LCQCVLQHLINLYIMEVILTELFIKKQLRCSTDNLLSQELRDTGKKENTMR